MGYSEHEFLYHYFNMTNSNPQYLNFKKPNTDEESRGNIERDYLNIHPTVKEMLNEINDLQIEIHPIFGFKKCVEAIEAEYPVKIVIHKEIPGDFYSDDETIQLVYELYDQRVDKGICCVFRYNNLLANYICLFNYLFISSQMSAKPYFIGSTGILLLW